MTHLGPENPQKPHLDNACPPQLHLGSRRTSGVLMGFLEVLAGVTKIKVAPNDLLGPSQHVADCFLINAQ